MAARRPSSRNMITTPGTAGTSNIIDLTNDSPPRSSHLVNNAQYASPSAIHDPRVTPNLRPAPTMNQQFAQGGSSMHNMRNMQMQMQQRLSRMSPQEQSAYTQRYRRSHPQLQAASSGNGQMRLVGGPYHTQGNNMGMATGSRSTMVRQDNCPKFLPKSLVINSLLQPNSESRANLNP